MHQPIDDPSDALHAPSREKGGSDRDQPYRFGRTPTTSWPAPFTHLQLARLLIVRGRVHSTRELHELLDNCTPETTPPIPGD